MQINELIIRSEELAKSCDSIISEEQVTVLEVLQLISTLHNINPNIKPVTFWTFWDPGGGIDLPTSLFLFPELLEGVTYSKIGFPFGRGITELVRIALLS